MKVYLIGCGPGDPELLTLKARRLIGSCDVIVYDDLIPSAVLQWVPPGIPRHYVGKRAGRDYMKQPEINSLLAELALQGQTVARLKGGDPCIFGRGGEEALFLHDKNIPFEFVPGITSAIAGPISAGIPPTHRGMAASVRFVTAHEDPSKTSGFLDWKGLAAETGTLVFLMGASRIVTIAEKLMAEGMPPETPSALIENATTPAQRQVFTCLGEMGAAAERQSIASPCIIVVGQVASLGEKLAPRAPLSGTSVLLTRPAHLSEASAALFAAAGARVLSYPLVDIAPLDFDLPQRGCYDMFIFTSQNAVTIFMDRLFAGGYDSRFFAEAKICCIGPKTRDTFKNYGIKIDIMADEYRAEGIVDALKDIDLRGMKICLPRASSARSYLVDALRDRGALTDEIHIYETVRPSSATRAGFIEALGKSDTVVFTSPSGIKNAMQLLGDADLLKNKTLAAIGPVTAKEMDRLGVPADVSAAEYTDSGIIEALKGENP